MGQPKKKINPKINLKKRSTQRLTEKKLNLGVIRIKRLTKQMRL
jgi:hypothetical protein